VTPGRRGIEVPGFAVQRAIGDGLPEREKTSAKTIDDAAPSGVR